MTHDSQPTSDALQPLVQRYLQLFAQQDWDAWIGLWASDGVLEFPFTPPGRRARYVGHADILAYMQATAARMAGRIQIEGLASFTLRPLRDPGAACLEMAVSGRLVADGAPYRQTYIAIIETQGGKLSLYREYWNPLVSIDAHGGREAWTQAFGSPATAP